MKKKIEILADCYFLNCYPSIDSEAEPYEFEDWIGKDKASYMGDLFEEEIMEYPEDSDYLFDPYIFESFLAPLKILSVKVDGKDITSERGEDAERFWIKEQFNHIPREEMPEYACIIVARNIFFNVSGEEATHFKRTFTAEIELEDGEEFDPKQLQLVRMPRLNEDSPDTWADVTYEEDEYRLNFDYCPTWALYKGKRIPLEGCEFDDREDYVSDDDTMDYYYHNIIDIESLYNIEED